MLAALPVAAVTVTPCTELAEVWAEAEPSKTGAKTFANGEVRVVVFNTGQPAATTFHLVMLHPPQDDIGIPACSMVSASKATGFSTIDFGSIAVRYPSAQGVTFRLPVEADGRLLWLTVNKPTGFVTAMLP